MVSQTEWKKRYSLLRKIIRQDEQVNEYFVKLYVNNGYQIYNRLSKRFIYIRYTDVAYLQTVSIYNEALKAIEPEIVFNHGFNQSKAMKRLANNIIRKEENGKPIKRTPRPEPTGAYIRQRVSWDRFGVSTASTGTSLNGQFGATVQPSVDA